MCPKCQSNEITMCGNGTIWRCYECFHVFSEDQLSSEKQVSAQKTREALNVIIEHVKKMLDKKETDSGANE